MKKGFKKGMMDPPMENAMSQRPLHSSPLPAMVADSLPSASLPRVVWPWRRRGLGPFCENGPFCEDGSQSARKTGLAQCLV